MVETTAGASVSTECSMLALWSYNEEPMDRLLLRQALLACARAEGASLNDTCVRFNCKRIKHIQHEPKEADESAAKRLRDKVFGISAATEISSQAEETNT